MASASRAVLRRSLANSAVAGAAFATGILLLPKQTLRAEAAPFATHPFQALPAARKPIYDPSPVIILPPRSATSALSPPEQQHAAATTTTITTASTSETTLDKQSELQSSSLPPIQTQPTPTDRLAAEIRHARLFLYAHTAAAEDKVNAFMSRLLEREQSFTQTMASLAEPSERLSSGAIYILVAGMAGSILTRNRGILLRASVPFALGLGTAYAILPVTSHNVQRLAYEYEERYLPRQVLANQMLVKGAWDQGSRQLALRANDLQAWTERSSRQLREAIDDLLTRARK